MRRGHAAGSAFTSSTAPSRGGSISSLSNGPNGAEVRRERDSCTSNCADEAVRPPRSAARARPARGCPRSRSPARRAWRAAARSCPGRRRDRRCARRAAGRAARTRARHEHPVDAVVHLGELGRAEVRCARRTRAARSRARSRPGGTDARCPGPPGCSHTERRGFRAKLLQSARSSSVSGSEMPEHQHRGVVADRDLDLRQAVADRERLRPARAAAGSGADLLAAGRGTRACRRRSSSAARGSRPSRRPSSARGAPTGARGGGSPTPRRRRSAAWSRAPPCRCAPRFSSSPRCLAAICVRASACCVAQPPQTPKCGQRGVAPARAPLQDRGERGRSRTRTSAQDLDTRRRSPGSAPSTNTTLPSALRATPRPSASSESMRSVRSSRARGTRASAARRASRACSRTQRALGLVALGGVAAAHQLEAQVEEIGVDAVGLAVVADRRDLARAIAVPHRAAAHAELAREAREAAPARRAARRARRRSTSTSIRSRWRVVEAVDVVVVAEVLVVVAGVPEARGAYAVDQAAVDQHRQVEAARRSSDTSCGAYLFDAVEEALDRRGLAGVGLADREDAHALVVRAARRRSRPRAAGAAAGNRLPPSARAASGTPTSATSRVGQVGGQVVQPADARDSRGRSRCRRRGSASCSVRERRPVER